MGARESAETRAALALLDSGLSQREAAKQAGVSHSTLWRALQRRYLRRLEMLRERPETAQGAPNASKPLG